MEKTEEETKKPIEKSEERERKKPIVAPQICSYDNEKGDGYIIEVILPGVEKDTINLKVDDENIFISGESDTIRYVGAYGLCCPISPKETEATYKNGLLKIKTPFKEIKLDTIDVKIE
jgi:HSP20 family molecular chaperone IbpA